METFVQQLGPSISDNVLNILYPGVNRLELIYVDERLYKTPQKLVQWC